MHKLHKQFYALISIFIIALVFLQATSCYLFYSYYIETGLSHYYFADDQSFKKTFFGTLEVLVPHIGSQGLIVFILAHFLVLYKNKTKMFDHLAMVLIVSCFFNIFAVFLIQLTNIAAIKVITFVAFQLALTASLFLVFKSFVFNNLTSSITR